MTNVFDRDAIYRANPTVSGPPAQGTVDDSGDAFEEETATVNAPFQGHAGHDATVTDLPHPATRPLSHGGETLGYPDPIAVLGHLERISAHLEESLKRVDRATDERIKRNMRGVLRQRQNIAGAGNIVISFRPVPPGEVWLVERYTVRTAGATVIRVFNGDVNDGTNQIDWTSLPENTADNNSPIRLWPGMILSFVATVPAADELTVNVQYRIVEVQ